MTGNIEVIYNPIEISKWKTEKIDYVENSILYVGTVMEGKGVGDLIEACRILRERNIPVTLKMLFIMESVLEVQVLFQRILQHEKKWIHC